MKINKINIIRIASLILFVILWAKGDISGLFAWLLLLMIIDIELDFKMKK